MAIFSRRQIISRWSRSGQYALENLPEASTTGPVRWIKSMNAALTNGWVSSLIDRIYEWQGGNERGKAPCVTNLCLVIAPCGSLKRQHMRYGEQCQVTYIFSLDKQRQHARKSIHAEDSTDCEITVTGNNSPGKAWMANNGTWVIPAPS